MLSKNILLIHTLLLLIFCGCAINYSALPNEKLNASNELSYLYRTDQKDRRRVLAKVLFKLLVNNEKNLMKDPKINAVSNRDSLRLSRVIELHKQSLIYSDEDKFHAASIYEHGGGDKMSPDTAYSRIAYLLFKELYEKGYYKSATKSLMNASYDNWQYDLTHIDTTKTTPKK